MNLGSTDPMVRADKWPGWPNGSAVFTEGGKRYKGRCIDRHLDGGYRYYCLRYNPVTKTHRFIGSYANIATAIAVL